MCVTSIFVAEKFVEVDMSLAEVTVIVSPTFMSETEIVVSANGDGGIIAFPTGTELPFVDCSVNF